MQMSLTILYLNKNIEFDKSNISNREFCIIQYIRTYNIKLLDNKISIEHSMK